MARITTHRIVDSRWLPLAFFCCLTWQFLCPIEAVAARAVSLAGRWGFELDRADVGVNQRWFERHLDQSIQLPGALQNQGFGDDITPRTPWTGAAGLDLYLNGKQYQKYREPGNVKVPFCLQPEKHYVGVAWYQRLIDIPAGWRGQRVVLTLERPHWESRVWLDGRLIGTNNSLSTPHVYELGHDLTPGSHRVSIRIDNRVLLPVGDWSHSVSDHTQGNWNGVVGRIELAATSPVWIDDVQVYPTVASKTARVKGRLGNSTGRAGRGSLQVNRQTVPVTWTEQGGEFEVTVELGARARTWDEFQPALETITLRLKGEDANDRRTVAFGLREIAVEGKEFVLNGRKTFLRGTLECCIFPTTGYPPTDVAAWRRIIKTCKAHGLNHIRFHSWCPPEAAFEAADELGFYYQVECGVWTNPGEGEAIGAWIYGESERIVRAYGNHPSFVLLTHGNEPHGKNHETFLAGWVNHWKQRDPRRLVTSGSAYPQLPENQYHVYHPCRGPHGWLGKDYRADVQALTVPAVVHEMGQWCVYPNFDEVRKYTGPLKPKNFDIFRDSLAEHHMLDQWRDFLHASGKLQALCYKEEIEAALRTPGISGFQLLDLHDFPGQGTALVGVLDPFWESKGYISAAEYRRFCNSTVPLARVLKRTWTTAETFSADIEVAHYGPGPLKAQAFWRLVADDGQTVARSVPGSRPGFGTQVVPVGHNISLGRIEINLASLPAPRAYTLIVGFKGTDFVNDWKIWVYPAKVETTVPQGILMTPVFDSRTIETLAAGGRVLLAPPRLGRSHPRLGFEPVFWNRYMFNTQGRQTLGLICDPNHPALARYPTGGFQDWQWNDILSRASGMVLDGLPADLRPIIQVIDDWNSNRRLGLVWECRVGAGRLLVCAADLETELDRRPASRQLRSSLLAYMAGPRFTPSIQVAPGEVERLLELAPPSRLARLGARVLEADSEDVPNHNVAGNAIDGNPESIWHTKWTPNNDPMPHWIVIDLSRELTLKGISYLPRQDQSNGRIAQCEVFCSLQPGAWETPIATPKWPDTAQPQVVEFKAPVKTRYLKILIRSEVNRNPFASIAELDVVTDDK